MNSRGFFEILLDRDLHAPHALPVFSILYTPSCFLHSLHNYTLSLQNLTEANDDSGEVGDGFRLSTPHTVRPRFSEICFVGSTSAAFSVISGDLVRRFRLLTPPTVTFATLGEKTTIMSPEVLVKAWVPCCRLVQNAGEFVVTFPRAYHSGFSHGFNCGEAANIATPGWLTVARDAAIRRASINCAPMVSNSQLLYDLALSFSSSVPTSVKPEPRSSRLKDKLKPEGETLVKRLFLQDIMQNNRLLHILGKGSSVVLLPEELLDRQIPSGVRTRIDAFKSTQNKDDSYTISQCDKKAASGIFSCVTCGVLCYACIAIIRPTEAAANYLMSTDCEGISDLVAATGIFTANEDASFIDPKSSTDKR